jgi:hypothetical protein
MEALQPVDSSLSPQDFFNRYVSLRKPAHFKSLLQDSSWKTSAWTNDYLKSKAGEVNIKVEYRDSVSDRYGQGKEKIVKFGEFIDSLTSGSELLYLTTQQLNYTIEGQPFIISHPITELKTDIPIKPELMGNLIVQNINLWMGASSSPTTSGLHHDYHDNLYILLRGTKTLTLFPPSEYKNMYLTGFVSRLHENGRFNYRGQPTKADGSCIGSAEALEASHLVEAAALRLDNEVRSFYLSLSPLYS